MKLDLGQNEVNKKEKKKNVFKKVIEKKEEKKSNDAMTPIDFEEGSGDVFVEPNS